MPPSGSIAHGEDSVADEIRVFGGQLVVVATGKSTDEGEVAIDIAVPLVLAKEPAEDVVEMGDIAGLLDVADYMGIGLLMHEPEVTMAFYMPELSAEGVEVDVAGLNTLFLRTREHYIVTILNFLGFHIVLF